MANFLNITISHVHTVNILPHWSEVVRNLFEGLGVLIGAAAAAVYGYRSMRREDDAANLARTQRQAPGGIAPRRLAARDQVSVTEGNPIRATEAARPSQQRGTPAHKLNLALDAGVANAVQNFREASRLERANPEGADLPPVAETGEEHQTSRFGKGHKRWLST
jgi:hypothetical protein